MVEIKAIASGSKGNLYTITDFSTPLLLEAGLSIKEIKKALNFQVISIAGCLCSHCHADHSKSIKDLIKSGIDCYMTEATAGALEISGHHRVKIIRELERFQIGTWTCLAFPLVHDVECVGFLLVNRAGDKLVYLSDTAYCRFKFSGLTHVLIETNYSPDLLQANVESGALLPEVRNRIVRNHMSLETTKGFLRANDLKRVEGIWLIHCSEGNSDTKRFKREIQALTGKPVFIKED